MTLQMVELWHRTDTVPRLRGPSLERWREKDNNYPAPSYEELKDGSVQFCNGLSGRPCRNLCEFEKDLLTEFYLQQIMPVGSVYDLFQLSNAHWQIPGAQFQGPDAPFEIPSFVELEIWRQKLNTPTLKAWEAFVEARQTKAQKKERDASIKAWMKMMHDMFWHKNRRCRCKGKKKGISGRDPLTPEEKFQEMVKDMVFGVKWAILKMKFETLPENEPVEEAFMTGPWSEQQDNQYAYIEEPNAFTYKPAEEHDPIGSTFKSIETRLRHIEDEKLWEIFKMAEKRIKWPRSTAELRVWRGAEVELRESIQDCGYPEFLKNVNRHGSYEHDSELTEDEIKLLNAQGQPPVKVKPPRTPRNYRKKTKKDAVTRAAEAKAAKARKHSFIKFFLKNPQMNNAAEDEYINELLQKSPRKRYAPRRMPSVQVDNSDPWAAQEEYIQRIVERSSRNKKEAKSDADIPNDEVVEDNDLKDSPSKKISIRLTIKKPGDEQIQQQGNEEILDAPVKKSTSRKRKSPQKSAGGKIKNGEGDEEMLAAPVKTPKTPYKRKSRAKKPAQTPNETAIEDTPSKQLNIASMTIDGDVEQISVSVKASKNPYKRKSRAKKPAATPTQADSIATPETPKFSANTPFENATNDTPSQQLKLGSMTLEDQENEEMMDAPAKTPITPTKRKISAQIIATATATPKKRKSAVKMGERAVDESPTKKSKTTHTKENSQELDDFYNLIDPLLR